MKKLLAMVLVLGFATTAFGGNFEWRIGATDGAVATPNHVVLMPSQTAELQLWLANAQKGLFNAQAGLSAENEGGFEVTNVFAGPGLTFDTYTILNPPRVGAPIDGTFFNVYESEYEGFMEPDDYHLLSIVVGWTEPDGLTTISVNTLNGAFLVSGGDWTNYTQAELGFGAAVIVETLIPEPASLALLALGGLALIRRR